LKDEGAIEIARLYTSGVFPSLVKIGLNSNNITDIGVCALAEAIDARIYPNSKLEVLGLSANNAITSVGTTAFASVLRNNSKMLRLFFNNCNLIGNNGAIPLIHAASKHPTLLRLGLSDIGMQGAEIGKELIDMMETNSVLERVCVCGNRFESEIENSMKCQSRFNFKCAN
jgi:hypothetical protein